ncbi:ABC transporter substrate-binding protein [Microlunatus capsulatus]|uniref:Iron complex transport system substrate-binding protein n=1 Tax=Microlunatus capsulatus TaxID=99117 RepID=A0ABS4ZAP5_9ACTN|nr:ABC transporter substrate-binding protein [Microlunatus capsulatus]MBP2418071.1 iron complex transport system substrate-binding protein [Microlunatus capsulatus]
MRRRQFLSALGGAAAAAAVAGCANQANRAPAAGASATPAGSGFPVQVRHRYGTTTVPAAPQRVVTLGQTDHDALLALGVVPVAVAGFVDSDYSPARPWNEALLGPTPPVLNMLEIPFEKVAALQPDLVLGVMSGLTEDDHTKLSAIAPTVAQPVDHEDWAVPFPAHTRLVGAALGRAAEADRLVTELEAAFAEVRAQNPVLVGKRAACAELWGADFAVLGTGAPRTQFLTDVGMTFSGPLAALAGKGYNAPLSAEKVDLLDELDVVVWTTEHTDVDALLDHEVVRRLRTTTEGRYLLASNGGEDDLLYSMDWGSVLSNRWAIEHAVPRLIRAVDGDSSTDANSAG